MAMLSYLLVAWGLSYLVTTSVLLRPLRRLISKAGVLATTLIYCRACAGFWVGLVLGLLDYPQGQPIAALPAAIGAMGLCALCSEFVPNYAYEAEQQVLPKADAQGAT